MPIDFAAVGQMIGPLPEKNPRLHLAGVYQDEEGGVQSATVVVFWYWQGNGLPVSWESAERILAQARTDGAIASVEGYDEDPTARYYQLRRNEYVSLLRPDERQAVADYQYEVEPRRRHPQRRRSPVTGRFKRWDRD